MMAPLNWRSLAPVARLARAFRSSLTPDELAQLDQSAAATRDYAREYGLDLGNAAQAFAFLAGAQLMLGAFAQGGGRQAVSLVAQYGAVLFELHAPEQVGRP